ncbi:hypothetical protein ACH3VS_35685 [Streptomyces sp. WSLK1-3]|uniref:hypothetical protein n=1 Tax=Streptomyces sp. WSLK1-3 TaxID=3375475 RepID=UPI0037AAE630
MQDRGGHLRRVVAHHIIDVRGSNSHTKSHSAWVSGDVSPDHDPWTKITLMHSPGPRHDFSPFFATDADGLVAMPDADVLGQAPWYG